MPTLRRRPHTLLLLWSLVMPLVGVLADCTDQTLPTAVPTPRRQAVVVQQGARLAVVSAGGVHTCALESDGTVACWGRNNFGQATPPAGRFTQVSAGGDHTCGVQSDGTVACWGAGTTNTGVTPNFGQAMPPAGTFTQVSAGDAHTCGVKSDGTVACWGAGTTNTGVTPNFGQAMPPAGTFTQVSASSWHTCGVKSDGTVACWGAGTTNTGVSPNFGQAMPPAGTFTQVSAGGHHTCGVQSDGTVACWGAGTTNTGVFPSLGQAMPPAGTFTQVDAGGFHTCGVKSDGTVACWGNNFSGQAAPPGGTFTEVSSGSAHTCGVKSDGTVACWGLNNYGQATPPGGAAAAIPGVSAGHYDTCALKSDGTLACWGYNAVGQATAPAGTFLQVSAGGYHTCGVKSDGAVACWGLNNVGQSTPPAGSFLQVSAGFEESNQGQHTCGVRSNGTVACWGAGTTNTGTIPNLGQAIPPGGTFLQVSAGGYFSCGVKSDRTIACWGNNALGQAAPPAGTFAQVSAGGFHTCAVKSDGTLACWGDNTMGQATAPAGTFLQVSAGQAHSCGVQSDGTVACWGRNAEGQATPPAGTFVQVSAGRYHTCGVKSDGTIVCWGENSSGETDVPAELAGIAATTTALTVTPGTQQYSDFVLLTVSVLPAPVTGSIQLRKSVDGGVSFTNLGSPFSLGAGVSNTSKQQILEAAGTAVQFQAVFTPTGSFSSSTSAAQPVTVTKENATILYAGTNAAALQVASPGGSLAAGSLMLALQVKETSPDLADNAGIGDVANAGLSVTLAPVGPGTSYPLTCTAGPVSGTGYDAVRPFTCTNPAAVAVNAYEVQAAVTGNYYTGTYSDAFTVFDPSLGFATGGGSVTIDGESVNFGFTMKYNSGGTNLQGNFIAVRHRADGTVARMKSNALAGLAVGQDPTVPMGWASFGGKATYTTWDAGAGAYVTVGNQGFTVYAEDRNNPGAGVDRIWIGGPGALAMPGTPATATANAATLTSGNIGVPHGAGKATP